MNDIALEKKNQESLKSMDSSDLFARALNVAPGGVHSPVRAFRSVGGTPVFFKSAEGAYLTSVEGKRYLDFCQSFGPLILGHRDPDVAQVVRETIETAWSFGACEPYSLELGEWIQSHVPHVEKLRFVSSGTEAVMSALRVARAATGRKKVLKFEGCYHGHVDSLLVKAGSGLADSAPGVAASDSAGVSTAVATETVVAPLDDCEGFAKVFHQHRDDLAAVIIEPMPANYGLLLQRKNFLENVQLMCQWNKTLLIFDEVISGFRVALGGMAELTGIKPDLVTYGKVMGGGFPVGCYGGRKDLMDLVAPNGPVYQAGTLSANPVGMRAGLATLKKAKSVQLWEMLEEKTSLWAGSLNSEFEKRGSKTRMAHFGSVFWLHRPKFFSDGQPKPVRKLSDIDDSHAEAFKISFHKCLEAGVYLAPSGYEVGFISFAHTDADLNFAKGVILENFK